MPPAIPCRQDALPPLEIDGKMVYRYKSHYWKWKLHLWQFLPFYDPRVKAAQDELAAEEADKKKKAEEETEADAAAAADEADATGGGGKRKGSGNSTAGGSGKITTVGSTSKGVAIESEDGEGGRSLSPGVGGSRGFTPPPTCAAITGPDWCHLEDTGTKRRLVSDDERWDDVVRIVPWNSRTLYSATMRNLATKCEAGLKSTDLQHEAAHGLWELASNRSVHHYILNYSEGIPDAVNAAANAYVPPDSSSGEGRSRPPSRYSSRSGHGGDLTTNTNNPVFDSLLTFFETCASRAREPASVGPSTRTTFEP